eukprot:2825078-Prymnesium_polylepis.3
MATDAIGSTVRVPGGDAPDQVSGLSGQNCLPCCEQKSSVQEQAPDRPQGHEHKSHAPHAKVVEARVAYNRKILTQIVVGLSCRVAVAITSPSAEYA